MPALTLAERLYLMPYGAQQRVADALKLSKQYVSQIARGVVDPKTPESRATVLKVQRALAAEMGRPVAEVFPETKQEAPRRKAKAS